MPMQSTVTTNRLILAGAIIFLVLCITYLHLVNPQRNSVLVQDTSQTRSWWVGRQSPWNGHHGRRQRWPDAQLQPLPVELQDAALNNNARFRQVEGYVNVAANYRVYYRQVKTVTPNIPKGGVLFLHGVNYTSEKWLEMGTLHLMANMGFRAIAIDLPGKTS